ncbi:MAG: hypothetical protein GY737_20290 [Desulfobacteraceae bacterium]|nr:hypothetical protein [Desulfobacteraceae bacterium]
MSQSENIGAFLACFAHSVNECSPSDYFPAGQLNNDDIDNLTAHFLYTTPRAIVILKLRAAIGDAAALDFLTTIDPMDKVRNETTWRDTLVALLKKMAANGILTWGVMSEPQLGLPPLTIFHVQVPEAA